MGDFNAKVVNDNRSYEEVMGKQGLGVMNENGERFENLCVTSILVIGGSIFAHRDIYLATWISPDHSTKNQIGHICISRRFRKALEHVKIKRGADVVSGHHLVTSKLKLKLKQNWTNVHCKMNRFNTWLLKDAGKLEEYRLAITNMFLASQELHDEKTIDEQWKELRDFVSSTCKKVLRYIKTTHKKWISPETIDKIIVRKQKKAGLNTCRTRALCAKIKAIEVTVTTTVEFRSQMSLGKLWQK